MNSRRFVILTLFAGSTVWSGCGALDGDDAAADDVAWFEDRQPAENAVDEPGTDVDPSGIAAAEPPAPAGEVDDRDAATDVAPAAFASGDQEPVEAGAVNATRRAEAARNASSRDSAQVAPRLLTRFGRGELEITHTPAFQRRVMDSYVAVSDVEPPVTLLEQEDLFKIFEHLGENEIADAERLVKRNLGEGSSAVFDYTLAQIYEQRDDLRRAVAGYRACVDKYPNFRRAWVKLGDLGYNDGRFAEAAEALTRVVELGGSDSITFGYLGGARLQLGQPVAAESAFRMAMMLDPATPNWKIGLAQAARQQGRYADAAALYLGLAEEQPDSGDLWLALGDCYSRLEDVPRAIQHLEMAVGLGVGDANVLYNLGDLYGSQEQFDLAVDSYLRALARDTGDDTSRVVYLAKVLTGNGAFDDVRRLVDGIEQQLGENLEDAAKIELAKMRARVAVAEGVGGEEQIQVLEEVVALDPFDGEALILLGQNSAGAGKEDLAATYFERASRIEEFEGDAKLRHGELLVRQGKYGEALPLLRRAYALNGREFIKRFLDKVERAAQSR